MYKPSFAVTAAAVLTTFLALPACQQTEQADPSAPPPPTYRGPDFLQGTIGSLASVQGYRPVLVSGYGLVAGLENTGAADAPPALRQWAIDEASKREFGRAGTPFHHLRPEEVVASEQTAIVLIEGIIPPGSPRGTRFDLMVSALPSTQTTSIRGGTLYTADLSVGGRNSLPTAVNAFAYGRGAIFSSPYAADEVDPADLDVDAASDGDAEAGADGDGEVALNGEADVDAEGNLDEAFVEGVELDISNEENPNVGRVLAGGVTTVDMPLQLVTTRPSYLLTRQIADRINGAYPPGPEDDRPIAEPQNDTVIRLNITEQFKDDPREMLEIITHLHMNPQQDHARRRARQLTELLADEENAEHFNSVVYSWKGMGRPILEYLRELYEHSEPRIRLAALTAGTYLRDTRAATPLIELVESNPAEEAEEAAALLGELLRHRPDFSRVGEFLRQNLDHDDPHVRLEAYGALAAVEHPSVQRFGFERKLELAHAQSSRPMVHLARRGVPRVIVFGTRVELAQPLFFSAWDNRFMLRADSDDEEISVFYQPRGRPVIRTSVPNNLVHLVGAMAYRPEPDAEAVGLDMSYAEIAYILQRLQDEGLLDAPLVLEETDLTRRIVDSRATEGSQNIRPETGGREPIPGMDEDLAPALLVDPAEAPDADSDAEPAPDTAPPAEDAPPAQFER